MDASTHLLICPEVGSLDIKRALVIWLIQQALEANENRLYTVSGTPLFLQNVQTNVAMLINIGMETGGLELYCRSSVRVIRGKLDSEL